MEHRGQNQLAQDYTETCEAKTRRGTECRNAAVPGKLRCRFHGGLSTGPTSQGGKDRIAEAQRYRWERWRAAADS
ncbi:hypothetical protein EOA13_18015 [Mesorhizobium sp. M7A.F.Ca.US.011.01.1.1]|nr:hypothetical protein EOA13_18015 [Mesorhizobium sp. M7A.F.Ca.US.011.01.1.1]